MIIFVTIVFFVYLLVILKFSSGIYYDKNKKNDNFHPFISVIVAARNEEHSLPKLLKALSSQTYPKEKYEVIIVDDRSTDSTSAVVDNFKNDFKNLILLKIDETPLGWSNKKWALKRAIENSTSKILLQTDADCVPRKEWINSMIDHFKDPNVGLVCGPTPLIHQDSFLSSIFEMESLTQESVNAGAIKNKFYLSCTGRNIAFTKDIFKKVDGYIGNEHIKSGDDDLLLQKIATKTNSKIDYSINPNSIVVSQAPIDFDNFIKQRLRYASKGLYYFQSSTTFELKFFLILLFITNLSFIFLMFSTLIHLKIIYLFLIFIKAIADFFISSIFFGKLKKNWSLLSYLVLTILHPFYVVSVGLLGPMWNISWKK